MPIPSGVAQLTARQQEQVAAMRNISRGAAWQLFQKLPPGVTDFEDLAAIADEALCKAVAAWPSYCAANGHDQAEGERLGFLVAYVNRRVNGAVLDWARSADWLTRSERATVKRVQQAEDTLGTCTLAEAAALAGVDLGQAQAAVDAASWRRPVGLDEHVNADGTTARDSLADEAPATESEAAAAAILRAAMEVIEGLDKTVRWLLIMRYYDGMDLDGIAVALGLDPGVCRKTWEASVLRVHHAMLLAATGDGGCACGGRCACG